jgi:glycerol dehydrogenase
MSTSRAVGFPLIYRQGPGILDELGEFVRAYGRTGLIVADSHVRSLFELRIVNSCSRHGVQLVSCDFSGESSIEQIELLTGIARNERCEFVVGFGGGKAQDVAKGVKKGLGIPVVIVPTIASNDAATSRLAITYTNDGKFVGPIFLDTNPDAVFVDSTIVSAAPIRYLISGIGDALSTYFEADQCRASGAVNFFDARPTRTSLVIAKACYETIREHAPEAVRALREHRPSASIEDVIEANVLMSGLGFEGCGVAAAHAIAQGFTLIDSLHGNLHGEEVAVALLSQLVLENRDDDFLKSMIQFYREVGIPASLRELGLVEPSNEILIRIATYACRPKSRIYNMNRSITVGDVVDAMRTVEHMVQDTEG